jgi:hypothetical protein
MRKGIRPSLLVIAGAAGVALALGAYTGTGTAKVQGGAVGSASPPAAAHSDASPARTVPAAAPGPSAPTRSNEQRAGVDATAILASFVVPPHATRLPRPPSVGWGVLKQDPMIGAGAPYYVDKAGVWRVPGAPQRVLGWVAAHLPRRFTADGGMTVNPSSDQVALWMDTFALPPVSGVLYTRQMTIEVVNAGGGQTDMRVDALVNWLPPRPASEVVPASARVVKLSEVIGSGIPGVKPPAPTAISSAATVRALVAAVNALPLAPPDYGESCPADFGAYLDVSFQARPGGAVLAMLRADLTGCGLTYFEIGGKEQPALGTYGGAHAIAAQLLKLADLPWTLP